MSVPKLYTFPPSGNGYKVRLLASLLGIKLEEVVVDFDKKEQHSPEFLAINPRGTVPALAIDDRVLTDSAAILVYLAGRYQAAPSYWSDDPVEQATIVDWLAFESSYIKPGLSRARLIVSFIRTETGHDPSSTEKDLKEAQSLGLLEKQLEKGEWIIGDRVTIADVSNFSYVALAPMGDVSLDAYPAVQRWVARIKDLKGFLAIDGIDDPMYTRRG